MDRNHLLATVPPAIKLVACAAAAFGAARLIHWYLSSKSKQFFQDKVVLITGASSGLGKAMAHKLHSHGAQLILAARSIDKLKALAEELSASNPSGTHEPIYRYLDLAESNAKGFDDFLKDATAGTSGRLDILINNGGMSVRGSCEETTMEVHRRVMEVNYFGQIALTKAALPYILTAKGLIAVVSSVQGKIAIPYRSSYAASKHAVQAYFDCLRAEVAGAGVKVLNISPGYIQTELSLNALTGSGQAYGKMDDTIAKGMTSQDAADRILDAVISGKEEIVPSGLTPKLAILIRYISPPLYFYIMQMRAKKEKQSE